MKTTSPSGVPPEARLASIDILRGVALFGVMAVNLVTEFRVSIFQQFLPVEPPLLMSDRIVEAFVSFALESKAFALFSMLFGVGLAIQFDRLSGSGRALYWLARRLAVLLLLGLVHLLLLWNGDILVQYALAGFLVLAFLCAPTWVLAVGFASLLALYVAMPLLHLPIPWLDTAALQQHVSEANRVYATGGVGEIWRFSLRELPLFAPLHIYIFPRTVALFLFGAFVWRSGFLRHLGRYKLELAVVACTGIAVGAAFTTGGGAGARLATVIFALGYGAAVMVLVQLPVTNRALSFFAPLGRMAFTNYVMQSLVFGFVFFGYGLGQFGRLGAAHTLALGVAVYAMQMLLSTWWLGRFRFGPIEWLWRTLMYGEVQPMVARPRVGSTAPGERCDRTGTSE
ncbi:MAG: DUF418 domain-containing protein [Betaproteobacteria bacterium]|nr:DUF418 domain-containing protein [Betaproteobacteria bacterium]